MQLFFQSASLLLAIFWTLALIGKIALFCVKGMKNLDTKIDVRFYVVVSLFWTLFFYLMNA